MLLATPPGPLASVVSTRRPLLIRSSGASGSLDPGMPVPMCAAGGGVEAMAAACAAFKARIGAAAAMTPIPV